ncbi:hypothetical protein [Thermococcus sibiricus]|uniref:hypothetical protein n=1 Tax=Thermococcus sibiricus TaxID=172049 RepID=UPI0011D090E1|nr:hypothetical protein [Thermococcus sibiricus]
MRINGEAKNVTFRVQKAWNWNNFAFDFIPEKPLATSGEVIVDLRPVVDKVVKEIIADEYSDYTEGDIIWSSLAFGTYTGSNGNNFELGWILYDARVIQLTAPPTPEKKLEEKPTEASNIFTVLGFYYYFNYQRDLNKYMILKENLSSLNDNLTAIAQTLKELGEKEYSEASRISGGAVYTQAGNLRVFVHLRKAFLFMRAAKEVSEYSLKYHSLLKEYESLLLEAQYLNIEPELIEKAEELKTQAENEYMNAISYPKGDLKVVKYIKNAYWLIKEATEELEENVIFSTKFKEFWSIASTKGPGDIQFTWWDQWLEEPIQLSDGRTVWMQTNFWNIIGGQGEVFMRYIHRTDEFAFYVNLEKVETQWGGIAWATPEVIFAGRSPAVWWGGKPKVGGYGFFDLPLKASEINNYDSIWVKVDYNVTKRSDTLVRFGIGIWFENIEGWPAAEVYIPFFDDFGGLVLSDKENLGEVTTTMVINGRATQASFTLQRGWNPGNWWSFEFIPEDPVPSGEVYIDVKPLVAEIAKIIGKENTWVSMAVGSYSGSKGTGFQYGWIIHDVRVVKPEDVPSIG